MFNIFTHLIEKKVTDENVCGLCHTPTKRLHTVTALGHQMTLCEKCCHELQIPIPESKHDTSAEQTKLFTASAADRSSMLTQMALNYSYRK